MIRACMSSVDPWFMVSDTEMIEHQAQQTVGNVGTVSTSPETWAAVLAAQKWQQAEEPQQMLQQLAEEQHNLLDQIVAAQA